MHIIFKYLKQKGCCTVLSCGDVPFPAQLLQLPPSRDQAPVNDIKLSVTVRVTFLHSITLNTAFVYCLNWQYDYVRTDFAEMQKR